MDEKDKKIEQLTKEIEEIKEMIKPLEHHNLDYFEEVIAEFDGRIEKLENKNGLD